MNDIKKVYKQWLVNDYIINKNLDLIISLIIISITTITNYFENFIIIYQY